MVPDTLSGPNLSKLTEHVLNSPFTQTTYEVWNNLKGRKNDPTAQYIIEMVENGTPFSQFFPPETIEELTSSSTGSRDRRY